MYEIIKIYDCSNSSERPTHNSENMGPAENDIMRGLKKYSKLFNFKYVNSVDDADVVITNDIFPSDIKDRNIFKVKRMDGIYWQSSLLHRNDVLNEAARIADSVIFISQFSRDCFFDKSKLKRYAVILNNVDTSIFHANRILNMASHHIDTFIWGASASNWNREEKRFDAILDFSKIIGNDKIFLMGECNADVPDNIIKKGYVNSDYSKANILNSCHAFVNFSYRDAGSKVVCQALQCGLPVLYADSGGVPELVVRYGVGESVYDTKYHNGKTMPLSIDDIKYSYLKFRHEYYNSKDYLDNSSRYDIDYQSTMKNYFENIREYYGQYKRN